MTVENPTFSVSAYPSTTTGDMLVTPDVTYTAAALTTGRIYYSWVPVQRACQVTALSLWVSTLQAGSTARLGIYADAGGRPGALILDAGTVSTAAAGAAVIGSLTQQLLPGAVWLADEIAGTSPGVDVTANNVPTVSVPSGGYYGSAGNFAGWRQVGAGALPATASGLTAATNVPVVYATVA